MATIKGFIKNYKNEYILPITRAELVLDALGNQALTSDLFLAGELKDKDGKIIAKDLPGLITAAERKMLSGGGTNGSIQDIYNKLNYINSSLKFNDAPVNFYTVDANNKLTQTPILIYGTQHEIEIARDTENSNKIIFKLAEPEKVATSTTNTIIRSVEVDEFGRVTSLSGSSLANDDIPPKLTGKELEQGTLTNCTVAAYEEKDFTDNSVVYKKYVDDQFNKVNQVATEALWFKGAISDYDDAKTILNEKQHLHAYFKVTSPFTIEANNIYNKTATTNDNQEVKPGDTLIVYAESKTDPHKFVYVPSGDEKETIIFVKKSDTAKDYEEVKNKYGKVVFSFDSPFTVSNMSDGAKIGMNAAGTVQDGYLTAADWNKFNSYSNSLKVEYTPTITETTPTCYQIGSLTFGNTTSNAKVIYGVNNITSLELKDGSDEEYKSINPIIAFKETSPNGDSDVTIEIRGSNGIVSTKTKDGIELTAANTVKQGSKKYLDTDGYQFEVKIGQIKSKDDTTTIVPGLTDYEEFIDFKTDAIMTFLKFQEIKDSLKDETKTIYYGSTELVSIIDVNI